MKNNRREFIKLTGIAGISMVGGSIVPSKAAEILPQNPLIQPSGQANAIAPLNRFPRMVHEYFIGRIKEIEKAANKRRSELKTKSDAEAYVHEVLEKIQKCLGPWPEKTPLNAKVTKRSEREAYTIENVIFESRPGFPVTANLYIPKKRKFPLPAVLCACGHTDSGKVGYQTFSGLAQIGYVTLVFDPLGQGERLQYITSDLKPRHGIGTNEHIYAGNQMFLTGETIASWFTWDGIRAIDYLLSRPEVDPKHIGVTGVSGGGTQTTWLCGADSRITMAAPACFVTTFRHNLENEEAADTEQCPWRALSLGLDHSDFIAAMAPKPVILLSQERDFFDVRGTEESYARLKNLYRLLGAENNIEILVGPRGHSYPKESREAMFRLFNKATKISDISTEPVLLNETNETLWCTPKGQVGDTGAKNIFSFTSQFSVSLKKQRRNLGGEELKKAVNSALKMPPREGVPEFRIIRTVPRRLYPKRFAVTYHVETEPGILVPVYRLNDEDLYSRIPRGSNRALLYISHKSADTELREEPFLAELIRNETEAALFTCDVRGIGDSQPGTTVKTFLNPYGSDYFYAAHSIMLDYPYVGQKTFDILRVIDLLKSYGHEKIHLAAKGWGAIPATFAALLSDSVSQLSLKNALTSYSDIAETEEYAWPLQSFIPGVLKTFDLPDCYRELKSKNLRQADPWNAAQGMD